MLEGDVTFEVGGKTIQAGAGDFVFGPRDIPHRYTVGDAGSRMLFMLTPGGFEDLIRATSDPARSRTLPRPTIRCPRGTDDGRTSRRGLRAGQLKPADRPDWRRTRDACFSSKQHCCRSNVYGAAAAGRREPPSPPVCRASSRIGEGLKPLTIR